MGTIRRGAGQGKGGETWVLWGEMWDRGETWALQGKVWDRGRETHGRYEAGRGRERHMGTARRQTWGLQGERLNDISPRY